MTVRFFKSLYLLLTLLTFPVHSAELSFFEGNKFVTSLTLKGENLKTPLGPGVQAKELAIFNIWRNHHKTYLGYDLFEILNGVYGPGWSSSKKIVFTAIDGYVQFVPVKHLIKAAQGKQGLIATHEKGMTGFTSFQRNGKTINPGPLYLVWSHFTKEDQAKHADHLKWPYQLSSIRLD